MVRQSFSLALIYVTPRRSPEKMSNTHKVLIFLGLAMFLILLIRLSISKEKVYTVEADIQLYREDPNLKEPKIEPREDAATEE